MSVECLVLYCADANQPTNQSQSTRIPPPHQVLLLVSVVRATMESGRLEAPFAEVHRRWLAALQKMVRRAGRRAWGD